VLAVLLLQLLFQSAAVTVVFDAGGCEWTENSACYGHLIGQGIPRTSDRILRILLFTWYCL